MLEESNCKLTNKHTVPRTSVFGRQDIKKRRNSTFPAHDSSRFPDMSRRSETASPSILIAPQLSTAAGKTAAINMENFKLKWALKKIVRKLRALVIPTQTETGLVDEEWMNKTTEKEEEDQQSKLLLHNSDWFNRLFHLALALTYMIACWCISVGTVFDVEDNSRIIFIWMVAFFIDIFLSLNTVRLKNGSSLRTRRSILVDYLKQQAYLDLAMIIYTVLQHLQLDQVAFRAVILLVLLKKLCQKHQLVSTCCSFKGIVDSVLLLLVSSHFAVLYQIIQALLLFLSSKFAPQRCWLQHINIQSSRWEIQYIYSLYWAVTTIVTVGYGDITPQNEYEVVVTMIIELTGSALFGYLINVIGATMSEMKYNCIKRRKGKENLKEELGIADGLVKCLSLKDDLSYELRCFLKDNQKSNEKFSIKEEKRIWDKLRPDLKQRVLQETNIRVMKKCIFFLTYFSRNLQNTIAVKLEKRVFQPNERLGIDDDTQSFFIIDQGKADLQFGRRHRHKQIFKTLRTLNKNTSEDKSHVNSNLFGFTNVLLRKRTNLSALSKQFIVAYELKLKDFYDLVAQYPADFEIVCQLRDNILDTDYPESHQGPELIDPRTHFTPIKCHTVKKHNRNCPQIRKEVSRWSTRSIFNRFEPINFDEITEFQSRGHPDCYSQNVSIMLSSGASKCKQLVQSVQEISEVTIPRVESEQFDQAKNYSKYFAQANIDRVLEKFNPSASLRIRRRRARQPSRKSTKLSPLETVQ